MNQRLAHTWTRTLTATLLVSSVCPSIARAQESSRQLTGSLRAGAERDDNVDRRAGGDTRADFLTRYFANLDAQIRSPDTRVLLTLSQGGKLFANERDADTLLTQLGLGVRRWLVGPLELGLNADLKDRSENTSRQDYLRGGTSAALALAMSGVVVEAQAGWRYFVYKPNPNANSRGPSASASLTTALPANLSATANYTWLTRGFNVPIFIQDPLGLLVLGSDKRQDKFHTGSLQLRWRGFALVSAGYTFSANRSNSYGQNLNRHTLGAKLTTPLPLGLLLSMNGQLQRTRYEDPIELDANFSVDEDNRNTLTLSLSRALGDAWDAELRYSLYTQEFGVGDDYSRQTMMLAIGYSFDTDD